MSDDPIFPRKDSRQEEVFKQLAEEARRNLDAEFQKDRICHKCGAPVPGGTRSCPQCGVLVVEGKIEREPQPKFDDDGVTEVYGPPPMDLDSDRPDYPMTVYGPPPVPRATPDLKEFPVRPAYGPPPIPFGNRNWLWIGVAVVLGLFVLLAAAFLLGLYFYFSLR